MNAQTHFHKFAPALDWLTLATYNFPAYAGLVSIIRDWRKHDWRPGRWLQYDGFQNGDGLYYGHAMQSNEKEHYVVKLSGSNAQQFFDHTFYLPPDKRNFLHNFYATRVDIQVTAPIPDWWNVRELHDWYLEQRKTVSIIQSETGNTLYLGSRSSGRFVRFYEKALETLYLRLEFELKGDYARNAWLALITNNNTVSEIYASHLDALRLEPDHRSYFMPDTDHDHDFSKHLREVDANARLKWLLSLTNTFAAMVRDHDIGDRARDIFLSLAIDRGND
jgi:hypothetical protein